MAGLRKDLEFFRELGLIERKDVSVDGVVDELLRQGGRGQARALSAAGQLTRER